MNSAFAVLRQRIQAQAVAAKAKFGVRYLADLHLKDHDYPSHDVMWFVCLINRHAGTTAGAAGRFSITAWGQANPFWFQMIINLAKCSGADLFTQVALEKKTPDQVNGLAHFPNNHKSIIINEFPCVSL
jgi:hypothetical protein